MKKIILASVLAASAISASAATAVCAGSTSAGPGTAPGTTTSNFVRNAFTPKCSANVFLQYDDSATYFRVGSASAKGSRSFMGSTAGGSVASSATCNPCAAGDAASAVVHTSNPTSG